jgi:hypothetical protein
MFALMFDSGFALMFDSAGRYSAAVNIKVKKYSGK